MLTELFGTFSLLTPELNDDVSDRLNYYYTTAFLILLSMLVSFYTFYGRPIECWTAPEFKASWARYGGKPEATIHWRARARVPSCHRDF